MSQVYSGSINGHVIGIVVKELVRRAMAEIRKQQFAFEIGHKDDYDGGTMKDVFTTADTAAQRICLRILRECFPHCGIVAEEDMLIISGSDACAAYFTLDPLDGTKAFIRRQVHGVGTMIALVEDGVVTCAYIGDINAEVVYGFRPDSNKVHRINRLDIVEELTYHTPLIPGEAYALLRDPADTYSRESQRLIRSGLFKSHNVDGGSIGIWAARLWRREVQALLIPPGWETPWDSSPVIGISQKLGYAFLRSKTDVFRDWERYEPELRREKYRREHDTLIIHENDLGALSLQGLDLSLQE